MSVGGRRAEETPDTVKQEAEYRKQDAEFRRRAAMEAEGLDPDMDIDVGPLPMDEPILGEVEAAVAVDAKDAELAQLRAQLAAKNAPPPPPDPRDAEIARLRAELAGESAPVAPPRPHKVPVMSVEDAELFGEEG